MRAGATPCSDLCEFLGLDAAALPPPLRREVNAGIAPRNRLVARLYYQPHLVHAVRRFMPRAVYRPIRRLSDRVNDRPATRQELDPGLRARLQASLDPDVRMLERLVKRDLSVVWW